MKPKTVKKVLTPNKPWTPEKLKPDTTNPPGTMKRAYKARPAL